MGSDRFEVSNVISPGCSGGPVMDLDIGHVVGVLVEGAFPAGGKDLGFGVADPWEWIQELLDKHDIPSRRTAPRAWF